MEWSRKVLHILMSTVSLSIADVQFRIESDQVIQVDDEFVPFLITDQGRENYKISFHQSARTKHWSVTRSSRELSVLYSETIADRFRSLRGCLMHLPMESLLLEQNRFFLHSSVIETEYGGILFSGPSGIGKSTQADLWCRFRGSRLINGDRAILHNSGSDWLAYGSPYAGSSACYRQEKVSVRTIVFLEKSTQNMLLLLTAGAAAKKLLLQICQENQCTEEKEQLLDLIQNLIQDIPVYLLQCTPDERAVKVLEQELKTGGEQ